MIYEEQRDPPAYHCSKTTAEFETFNRIETRRGFVEEQEFGTCSQRTGNGHALTVALR
jgi:hypothetical protein